MKLSVVIITLNEEKNIGRCLQSVKEVADEIVVVDSFSTDKTEDICKEFATKFIKHKFEDYVSQKQFAVEQCSFDYVLSIDADEALDETLKQEILNIKSIPTNNNSHNLADAYAFRRITNYCGERWIKHCGWYPDWLVRLFNKNKGTFQGIYIHEKVNLPESSKIVRLSGHLLHYSYYTINDHIEQIRKFTDLTALSYVKRKKTISLAGVMIRPFWTFIREYILQLGFLDGYSGWKICKMSAFATFIKYVKVRELQKHNSNSEN